MAMRYTGMSPQQLIASLYQRGQNVESELAQVVEASAEAIMKESVASSPVDLGNLEESHRVERRFTVGGNVAFDIIVGGVVDGVDVDEYLDFIHDGLYDLGPKSEAKMRATGHYVGRKFLENAFFDLRPQVVKNIREAVKRAFG